MDNVTGSTTHQCMPFVTTYLQSCSCRQKQARRGTSSCHLEVQLLHSLDKTASSRMSSFKFKANQPIGVLHSMAVWVPTISEMFTLHRRSKCSWAGLSTLSRLETQVEKDEGARPKNQKMPRVLSSSVKASTASGLDRDQRSGSGRDSRRRWAPAPGRLGSAADEGARTQKGTRRRHKR